MRYRYGKLNADDYIFIFLPGGVIIAASLFLLMIGDDTSLLYSYVGLVIGISLIAAAIFPRLERYSISEDKICISRGLASGEISLPVEMLIIISDADLASNPAAKFRVLHGRCAVTILHKLPIEFVLHKIHKNHSTWYTNATIEATCASEYVYSYVVEENMLGDLLSERNCTVIIPESLEYKFRGVFASHPRAVLYIDYGH